MKIQIGGICEKCSREGLHCPICGSKFFYHRQRSGGYKVINGQKIEIKGFHCRRCGANYNDETPCSAPRPAAVVAKQQHDEMLKQVAKDRLGSDFLERLARINPSVRQRLNEIRDGVADAVVGSNNDVGNSNSAVVGSNAEGGEGNEVYTDIFGEAKTLEKPPNRSESEKPKA